MKYEDFFKNIAFTVSDKDRFGNVADGIFEEVEYDAADKRWTATKGGEGVFAESVYKNIAITLACHKDSHEIVDLYIMVDPSLDKYSDADLDDGDWRAYLPIQFMSGNAVKSSFGGSDSFEFISNGISYVIPLEIDRVVGVLRESIAEARDYANSILGDYSD